MKQIIIVFTVVLLATACADLPDWSDPMDEVAPGTLTVTSVDNFSGGAWIHYSLPADNDLMGVKAIFSFDGQQEQAVFSSAASDSIQIDGAPEAKNYEIKLVVIDRSQNESQPVMQTISPLTPPLEELVNSMTFMATFGGIYLTWENPREQAMAISVLVRNTLGDWVVHDTHYTSKTGTHTFLNLPDSLQDFRFEIRDKWQRYAYRDTLLTPLFEEQIKGGDGTVPIWSFLGVSDGTVLYRGDHSWLPKFPHPGTMNALTDGKLSTAIASGNSFIRDYLPTAVNNFTPKPVYFTLDLGERKAVFSRFRFFYRPRSQAYFSSNTPIDLEIWGTNNPKPVSTTDDMAENLKYWTSWEEIGGTDTWKNDWVQIVDWKLEFPSGADPRTPGSALPAEDVDYIEAGFNANIDPSLSGQTFRYVRFIIKETTGNNSQLQFGDLEFFGKYID